MKRWRKRERDRKMEKVTWKDRERERAIERWKKRHGMIETERDRKLEKKTKVIGTSKSGKFSSENVWKAFFVFEVNNKQQVDKQWCGWKDIGLFRFSNVPFV